MNSQPTSPPPPPNSVTPTYSVTRKPTLEEDQSNTSEEATSPVTPTVTPTRRVESRREYNPGEPTLEKEPTQSRSVYSPGRSQRPTQAAPRGVTREDVVEIVGDAMKQLMETLIDPEMRQGRVEDELDRAQARDMKAKGQKIRSLEFDAYMASCCEGAGAKRS